MAEDVSGNGVDLVVISGDVDGGQDREQGFAAIQLVLSIVRGRRAAHGGTNLRQCRRRSQREDASQDDETNQKSLSRSPRRSSASLNPPVYSGRLEARLAR